MDFVGKLEKDDGATIFSFQFFQKTILNSSLDSLIVTE